MAQLTSEHHRTAERLMASGARAPEIEAMLVRAGLVPAEAARVVDEVMSARVAVTQQVQSRRPVRWSRVVAGLVVAVVGFAVVYVFLSEGIEEILENRLDVMLVALPGGLIAGLGLNMVRTELLASWRSDG